MNIDEKECPYCAEVIKEKSIKCRYCGSIFNLTNDLEVLEKDFKEDEKDVLVSSGVNYLYWVIRLIVVLILLWGILRLSNSSFLTSFLPNDDYSNNLFQESSYSSLENTPASDLNPHELSKLLSNPNLTSYQRDNKQEELRGKVVDWVVTFYDIEKEEDNTYLITTMNMDYLDEVATKFYITPRDNKERYYLEGLTRGQKIHIKGVITRVSFASVGINPVIIFTDENL
jgi:hypothetical protein